MWPTRSAPSSPSAAGAVSRSATRSTARSEPGSRPTRAAGRERPSAASTVMPSSIRTVWSAVTTMPARQWIPVDGRRRRACTATMDGAARSTAPARSFESASRASIRVSSLRVRVRPQHSGGSHRGHQPNGEVGTRPDGQVGLVRRQRLTGARADPVERLEEPIDVVAVAVYVRRHADAPFATPDQHPQAGESPRETGRVVGQEANVAGTLRGRLRREDREAARAQSLDQPPAQADRVLLHRLGGQLFQARERVVQHREAEQARVTRLEPRGVGAPRHGERIVGAAPVPDAVPAHGGRHQLPDAAGAVAEEADPVGGQQPLVAARDDEFASAPRPPAGLRPWGGGARKPPPAGAPPSPGAAGAGPRSPIANIPPRRAMPPLWRAPTRSQVGGCGGSEGAPPPVQRCATPSSPTN